MALRRHEAPYQPWSALHHSTKQAFAPPRGSLTCSSAPTSPSFLAACPPHYLPVATVACIHCSLGVHCGLRSCSLGPCILSPCSQASQHLQPVQLRLVQLAYAACAPAPGHASPLPPSQPLPCSTQPLVNSAPCTPQPHVCTALSCGEALLRTAAPALHRWPHRPRACASCALWSRCCRLTRTLRAPWLLLRARLRARRLLRQVQRRPWWQRLPCPRLCSQEPLLQCRRLRLQQQRQAPAAPEHLRRTAHAWPVTRLPSSPCSPLPWAAHTPSLLPCRLCTRLPAHSPPAHGCCRPRRQPRPRTLLSPQVRATACRGFCTATVVETAAYARVCVFVCEFSLCACASVLLCVVGGGCGCG